jgi:hypothetical protein
MKLPVTTFALSFLVGLGTAEAKERSFGVGTALGAGVGAASLKVGSLDASGVGALLLLPSLELRFFLNDTLSLDISSPLANTIILAVADYGFAWRTDINLTFNFGSGTVRGMVGPGLGAAIVATGGDVGVSMFVPGVLGVEFLTGGRGFGFQIAARPFVTFNLTGIGDYSFVAGGVLGVLGFVWYGT